VGFANYAAAVQDPTLYKALTVTFYYAVVGVPLQLALSFLVAVLMNHKLPGIYVFRTIYYLPSLVTGVAQIVLFIRVFNPQYGLLNTGLATVGIQGPGWLNDPNWAMPAIILMSLWTVGGNMVIYLAGLQDVPRSLYEAAALDGAGRLAQFWHVTIPQMSPIIFFNLITGTIGALQIFTQGYLTDSGPQNSLLFYVYYLYQNAFVYFHMGYGSALAWILFAIIMVLTALMFRSSALWVYYETEQFGLGQRRFTWRRWYRRGRVHAAIPTERMRAVK
jgi:multiple sugar transport system permease protein